jgi:hypothetical protein
LSKAHRIHTSNKHNVTKLVVNKHVQVNTTQIKEIQELKHKLKVLSVRNQKLKKALKKAFKHSTTKAGSIRHHTVNKMINHLKKKIKQVENLKNDKNVHDFVANVDDKNSVKAYCQLLFVKY